MPHAAVCGNAWGLNGPAGAGVALLETLQQQEGRQVGAAGRDTAPATRAEGKPQQGAAEEGAQIAGCPAGLESAATANGSPALPGAIARFDCIPYAIYPGGDHEIFVCEVKSFTAAAKTLPLIFHAGKYRNLKSTDASEAPPEVNMWLHGW